MLKRLIAAIMSVFSMFGSFTGIGDIGSGVIDCLFHKNTIETFENIRYADNERDVLDIYVPTSACKRSDNGCILFIHGGGWMGGNKEDISYLCERFAKKGYITATMNYTLYNENTASWFSSDVMLDEISAAVACIKSFSDEHSLHITKLATSGYSAGGHLSMLYSFSRGAAGAIPVVFTANMAGPADMSYEIWGDEGIQWASILFGTDLAAEYIKQGRTDEVVRHVSPVYYVNENTAPSLFLQGKKDSLVPYANVESLARAFEAAGVEYGLYAMPNSDHDFANDPEVEDAFYKAFYSYCKQYFGY